MRWIVDFCHVVWYLLGRMIFIGGVCFVKFFDILREQEGFLDSGYSYVNNSKIEKEERKAEAVENILLISKNVSAIGDGLEVERIERRTADAENMEYAKEINRKNLFWVRLSGILAVLAFLVSLAALFFSVTGIKLDLSSNPVAHIEYEYNSGQQNGGDGQPDGK